jgi:hypothetical protein
VSGAFGVHGLSFDHLLSVWRFFFFFFFLFSLLVATFPYLQCAVLRGAARRGTARQRYILPCRVFRNLRRRFAAKKA